MALGGEDTLGVATRLYKEHKVPVVGVPKTMDNDLSATDFTFGFDTATTIAVDAAERLRDTGLSHRRVMVLEVMGRHAGWVALYTAMASAADWVCLPEETVNVEAMCDHIKKVHARKKTALVITSEAVDLPGAKKGKTIDGFGHEILKERAVGENLAEIIQAKTGIETRSASIGHIQRGGSPTLFDRILGTRVGVAAADLVGQGKFGLMVALKGNDIVPVSLEEATAKLKDRSSRLALSREVSLNSFFSVLRRTAVILELNDVTPRMTVIAFHEFEARIAYADTDRMGVVYYANYLILFERGRTELMRSLGITYKDLEEKRQLYLR